MLRFIRFSLLLSVMYGVFFTFDLYCADNRRNRATRQPKKLKARDLRKTIITPASEYDAHWILTAIEKRGARGLKKFLNANKDIDLNLLYKNASVGSERQYISPLELAVDLGGIGKVDTLIRAGAYLDRGNHTRPLMLIALLNKDFAMMDYLAKYVQKIRPVRSNCHVYKSRYGEDCIDLNFHNSIYFWPFNYANNDLSQEQQKRFFELFDTHYYYTKDPQEKLSRAAELDRDELIDRAILEGGKVNAFDKKGNIPLHWAAAMGRIYTIDKLLKLGSNPNLKDKTKGRTPMQWLLRMHHSAVEKQARLFSTSELLPALFLLRAHGANPRIKDNEGKTVFQWLGINKQRLSPEEFTLIREVLILPSDMEKRKALLEKIYAFQLQELQKQKHDVGVDITKSSSGWRYFWHRPEWIRMRNSWVKNDDGKEFKLMYQEHVSIV